jgi:DNA-binding NarL/FixJ family response regulator
MGTLRILLADDHELVRIGARTIVEKRGWEVCGEAKTGHEAVKLVELLKPDVAVLDMGMPEMNGLEATREIKRLLPETEVLILTASSNEQLLRDVFESGARSYINKIDASVQLGDAIQTISEHKPFFTSKVSEILFARFLQPENVAKTEAPGEPLTRREREIVQLLAEGRTTKETADFLHISVKTAETHRNSIMNKLRVHNVAQLVLYAVRNGIVEA